MTNPGRRLRPGPRSVRWSVHRWVTAVLAALVGWGAVLVGAPAAEAATDPDVSIRITGVSPTELSDGATVTLSGLITNAGDERWTKAQAYLVIAPAPFTTRQQVTDAVESETTYTGQRVVELDAIDEVGTLEPGSTRPFRVQVPYEDLRVNGAEGVYPVGVQVLATAEDGTRDTNAIARATTFLPRIDDTSPRVPGGLVWPFVMPDRIGPDGTYLDAPDLAERVSPGGQLRNLLDRARQAPGPGTTIVLDPALLVGLDDLAEARRLPEGVQVTAVQRAAARTFLTDLTDLSRRVTTWSLDYARPDVLAISTSDDAAQLAATVNRATTDTLARFQLTGRRVTWPTRTGVTSRLLAEVRDGGERPVIVTRDAVPDWEPRLGSIVTRRTDQGPVPLFVNAGLDVGVPGSKTVATLRQRLVSEAAFASLERRGDRQSKADAFVLIDPTWNPGGAESGSFSGAFTSDFVTPSDLEDLLSTGRASYTGSVPRTPDATPLRGRQLRDVEALVRASALVSDLVVDADDVTARTDRTVADLLSVAWRRDRDVGAAAAAAQLRRTRGALDGLQVEGPPAITLSSSQGTFPLTVSNDTDDPIRVGVRISTSNPALTVPDVEPVEVEAGERRTITVTVDVGEQTSSTFTAQLITSSGTPVGQADSFNVRSSRVGMALWALMGAAGLFVLFALGRRFLRGRGRGDALDRGEPDE
ncbi:DUF6049 family protein [Aeromicrobium sp. 50.2.37]|uniref:DUF6049 family protein n=1 Tax=Aeromicrobium sp. 50.2.37 TaxID=2969305 RepID=UPI00214FE504|nr:DUF6049 family protein [Aeromicrobium sp. 50.2.37]MCR4512999.1 DUF6049 family protein [Aeromicrobium sp. 50.2.37]